jgi:hypothetical protein
MIELTARRARTAMVAALIAALLGTGTARAGRGGEEEGDRPVTIGVVGDMPYTSQQQAAFQGFLNAMSADSRFSLVVHLGDIKSGSTACTDAYIKGIRDAVDSYSGAFVYTPGDNEWTDCHRNAADPRNPVERLGFLRAKFFYRPGASLGIRPRDVFSQQSEPGFSDFVENQAWIESKTVFAVINLPGSNNDLDPWTHNVAASPGQQQQEFDSRQAADLEWLDHVFALAEDNHARAVVLGIQADMWDPAAGTAELTGYSAFIQELAQRAIDFGGPVLLLNGDSHNFEVDNPLAAGDPSHGVSTPVPNLTRITVQGGSDHFPLEYLRLTVDPRRQAPFSWERVVPTLAP